MRFRYHLQKIVDLKSSEKEQAEWVLSDAMSRLKLEEQSLEQLYETRRKVEQTVSEAIASRTSAAELSMLQDYLQHIDHLIDNRREAVQQVKQEVAVKSEQLVNKMKDEKKWLKVRERSYAAFRAEFFRQEQIVLDEIAAVRFGKS